MRTGHIDLNKHLHKIHRSDSPKCPHCPNVDEDAKHLLLQCWKYAIPWHHLSSHSSATHTQSNRQISHRLNILNKTSQFKTTYGDISAEIMSDANAPSLTLCSCPMNKLRPPDARVTARLMTVTLTAYVDKTKRPTARVT
jgi:hypothetical protein